MMSRAVLGTVAVLFLLLGCAPAKPKENPLEVRGDGSVTWQGEYLFVPPPSPWQLIDLNETDYSVAYMKLCSGSLYPCQSTFAYAEEPFGYSRDLEERQSEFFKRFLWASRVLFEPAETKRTSVLGKEGLEAVTIGREPVLGHKVKATVLFARRGERVVAFYYTQWRPEGTDFDPSDEVDFRKFVDSFGFLRASFYERLTSGSL